MRTASKAAFALAAALVAAFALAFSINALAEGETPEATLLPWGADETASSDGEWKPAEAYGASNFTTSKSQCRLCGICPVQPLGICLFVWIGAAAVLAGTLAFVLIRNRKKKKEVPGLEDGDNEDDEDE